MEIRKLLSCLLALALVTLETGCDKSPAPSVEVPVSSERVSNDSKQAIQKFCGDCHQLPMPSSFPKEHWHKEVRQGYEFYLTSLRSDLVRPVEFDAINFYQHAAPEVLSIRRAVDRVESPTAVHFERMDLPLNTNSIDPAIAQVFYDTSCDELFTTDMRSGEIHRWNFKEQPWTSSIVAKTNHPCRLTAIHWNNDTQTDYLLADLGSFLPEDHSLGQVLLLESNPNGFDVRVLVDARSRVVEVQSCDVDENGSRDLLVAEFGWRETGSLWWMQSQGNPVTAEEPLFSLQQLDKRHGVLGVRVADLDGDGAADIVAAFAQEHETLDIFWNRGGGRYEHQVILSLPDPSYGSSCFEVVDLNADGRLDILHANGDTMDSGLAKPYHGIRKLTNEGNRKFSSQEISDMVGVCQVSTADIDGDGDTDIVASSLHPAAASESLGTFDSVIWLEQVFDGSYLRHSIERDRCDHAAFAIVDVNQDKRPDILVGNWQAAETGAAISPLSIFLNAP